MRLSNSKTKYNTINQMRIPCVVLLMICVFLAAITFPAECFGQTAGGQYSETRARSPGGYDLNLYYDGTDHITHITATCNLGSSRTAHERFNYLKEHRTSWQMTSEHPEIVTVATPSETSTSEDGNYYELYPQTTLHIPTGYQTVSAECIDKISSEEEVFLAQDFAAGMTGDYILPIGGRTCNWGITTKKISTGKNQYYNRDLEYRIALEPISYTLTFDPAGGTFANATSPTRRTTTYRTSLMSDAGAAQRAGHQFDGWYTAAEGGTQVFDENGAYVSGAYWDEDGLWIGTADLTLYAHWTFLYDFSFDHQISGIEFDAFSPGGGGQVSYGFSLGNAQRVLFPGLDEGCGYQITEDGTEGFRPSYRVSEDASGVGRTAGKAKAGRSLSTRKEMLQGDPTFAFLNEQEMGEGTDLTLRKELAGDLVTPQDRQKLFTFRWTLQELDPDGVYTIDMSGATEAEGAQAANVSITPNAAGEAAGSICLHAGEHAIFRDLPAGARYRLAETGAGIAVNGTGASAAAEYNLRYEVTDGEASTEVDHRFYTAAELGRLFAGNAAAGTGTDDTIPAAGAAQTDMWNWETLQEGMPVEYVFTNGKYDFHDLTIGKERTEDGQSVQGNAEETFLITAAFTGLEPGTAYPVSSSGSGGTAITDEDEEAWAGGVPCSDAAGEMTILLTLAAGGRITLEDLPGSARCTLTEAACHYVPSIRVTAAGETLLESTGEYGRRLDAQIDGLQADTTAVFTNDDPLYNTLTVRKEYDGVYDGQTEAAEFSVHLTDLEPAAEYAVQKLDGAGAVIAAGTITAGADGTYTYTCSLRDTQSIRILRLPASSHYRIEEAPCAKVAPIYVLTSVETEDIQANSGSAAKGEALSTETERMTADRSYSFYNCIVTEPVKTVTDGTVAETSEITVPSLEDSWFYHIHQEVDVPVSSFRCFDTLPPFVRAAVFDPDSVPSQAPLRVFWHSGTGENETTLGGAVSKRDRSSGEYLVCDTTDPERVLFRIRYDENTGEQITLQVIAEDTDMLRESGSFDLYFRAYVEESATAETLLEADLLDGSDYRFVNEASTRIGGYLCETEPAVTLIPGPTQYHDLVLHKNVTGNLGDRAKAFAFTVQFTGLEPNRTYDSPVDPSLSAQGLSLQASDVQRITADTAGEAEASVILRDDESILFAGLPDGATYQITEAASDHAASYQQVAEQTANTEGTAPSFAQASDSNGNRANQPLQTAVETIDREHGTIIVTFRNDRNLATITGISSDGLVGLTAAALLLIGAFLRGLFARCRRREMEEYGI